MGEGRRAHHAAGFKRLGVVGGDPGRGSRDQRQQGKQQPAGKDQALRRGDHSLAPSDTRGSSQPTIRSVSSEITMKIVAIASTPTCTVG